MAKSKFGVVLSYGVDQIPADKDDVWIWSDRVSFQCPIKNSLALNLGEGFGFGSGEVFEASAASGADNDERHRVKV